MVLITAFVKCISFGKFQVKRFLEEEVKPTIKPYAASLDGHADLTL